MSKSTQASETTNFESWCIIELFGHSTVAGYVTEQTIGGAAFIRIDVPQVDDKPEFTKLYGPSAIYAITPTTEEHARQAAEYLQVRPVKAWVVPERPALPQPVEPGPNDDLDEWHDDDEYSMNDEGITF